VRGALFYNLALIAERRGDSDAARESYRRSLEARPGNAVVARALAALGGTTPGPVFDVDTTALDWWKRGDGAARERLLAAGISPVVVRVTASLNVRSGPAAAETYIRTLPEGTIVVVLRGLVDGIVSQPGRGNWSRVVASETLHGWVASGVTSDYTGCAPELGTVLTQLAGDRSDAVARDVLASRMEIGAAGLFFLLTARDPDRARSYVGLFASDRRCQLEQRQIVVLDGEVEDALVTATAQQGGEPLLAAGSRAFGAAGAPTTWRFWRLETPAPVWEVTVPTAMDVPDGRRGGVIAPFESRRGPSQGWWPVRVRRADQSLEYYTWTGTTFALPELTGDSAALGQDERP
jgi:hypothetical protein